jgi:hypothetical protein
MIETIGPELRQYIVANNREELPFNRRQRSWIYASSKKENNYQGFGTDQNMQEARLCVYQTCHAAFQAGFDP